MKQAPLVLVVFSPMCLSPTGEFPMDEYLWPITQIIVIGAAVCNLLSWAAIAFAIRYYAPYPRGEIK